MKEVTPKSPTPKIDEGDILWDQYEKAEYEYSRAQEEKFERGREESEIEYQNQ